MKKLKQLAVINAATVTLHLIVVTLVQLRLINTRDVGEISKQVPTLFTPADFTFSIWSVIYAGLLAFAVYHMVTAWRQSGTHEANTDLMRIGPFLAINNVATACWLLAWVNEWISMSVALILIQLITLIMIHRRLHIHKAAGSLAGKFFTQFPLSIYLGWISIATVANISMALKASGWSGWGISEINWTITLVAVIVFITVHLINRRKNVVFGLVVIWALYGILMQRQTVDPESSTPIILVIRGALGIVGFACLFGLVRNLRRR